MYKYVEFWSILLTFLIFIDPSGIGKGDGSDMSCEVFIGRMKVFECDFGQNKNCQVMKLSA